MDGKERDRICHTSAQTPSKILERRQLVIGGNWTHLPSFCRVSDTLSVPYVPGYYSLVFLNKIGVSGGADVSEEFSNVRASRSSGGHVRDEF
jgi:hypothetical protein